MKLHVYNYDRNDCILTHSVAEAKETPKQYTITEKAPGLYYSRINKDRTGVLEIESYKIVVILPETEQHDAETACDLIRDVLDNEIKQAQDQLSKLLEQKDLLQDAEVIEYD